MYAFPSTSRLRAPWPRAMTRGKGSMTRMSWLTPVGKTSRNFGYSAADLGFLRIYASRMILAISFSFPCYVQARCTWHACPRLPLTVLHLEDICHHQHVCQTASRSWGATV